MINNPILYRVKTNKFKHKHFSKDKIDHLQASCNLIQLLFWLDETRITYSNKQFRLTDYNYVVYDNMIHHHYAGISLSPLQTLTDIYDLTFPQAAYVLNYYTYKVNKLDLDNAIFIKYKAGSESKAAINDIDLNFILSEDMLHSESNLIKKPALDRVYAYLYKHRHIDRDIVSNLIKQRFIALDAHNNLCFLTYRDPLAKDEVTAITKKGTIPNIPFRQNYVKERHTGFFYAKKPYLEENNIQSVYVFESCIDLLSFLTLIKQGAIDKPSAPCCYISLNGAANYEYLNKALRAHASIKEVYLCLDNDDFGIRAAKNIIFNIPLGRRVTDMRDTLVTACTVNGHIKDWNDLLKKRAEHK